MKKIILNFEKKQDNFKEFVQEAFNKDILNFLISNNTFSEFKKIERINLYSKDLDLPANFYITDNREELKELLTDIKFSKHSIGFFKELKSKDDEKEVIDLSRTKQVDFIIVSAKDWKIIPFENIIAEMHKSDTDLIAAVSDVDEAELMLKTLEIGVDGVLLTPKNVNDIIQLKNLIHPSFQIELLKAKVITIETIPEAERVCVDTTSLLSIGEGLLVGSTAAGFCLVHSETFETQFVASRPFRVNAGDVSAYILVPDDNPDAIYRTKYLSELKGGDRVLAVSNKGDVRIVSVGRVKIETRPMLRFELECVRDDIKIKLSCICQNAETIRLVGGNGKAVSVVDIKIGDEVLVHIGPGATHFGTPIKETIIEK
ncbi:MAG: 3-dehydroquinate synthase II [Candidatus Lokiarchaeota archaeon]|nr:3-dehydroquinate synthase II [Candidatus Lokiarchaeota archaeon]